MGVCGYQIVLGEKQQKCTGGVDQESHIYPEKGGAVQEQDLLSLQHQVKCINGIYNIGKTEEAGAEKIKNKDGILPCCSDKKNRKRNNNQIEQHTTGKYTLFVIEGNKQKFHQHKKIGRPLTIYQQYPFKVNAGKYIKDYGTYRIDPYQRPFSLPAGYNG